MQTVTVDFASWQRDSARIADLEASMRHAVKIEDALRELVDAYKGNDGRGNSAERLDLAVRMAELVLKPR